MKKNRLIGGFKQDDRCDMEGLGIIETPTHQSLMGLTLTTNLSHFGSSSSPIQKNLVG
jgi:hypothetical protein